MYQTKGYVLFLLLFQLSILLGFLSKIREIEKKDVRFVTLNCKVFSIIQTMCRIIVHI